MKTGLSKKEKMRDLLCYAVNELLVQGKINLETPNKDDDEKGFILVDILEKPSVISWNEISYDELRVSIWWGIKEKCEPSYYTKPLARTLNGVVDVCCSCWVERATGKWIQGKGSQGIYDDYCSNNAKEELLSISKVKTIGYEREGKFFI